MHTTLVGINAVDTYRVCKFHSIFSQHKAIGFRNLHHNDYEMFDEGEAVRVFTEGRYYNEYTMKAFAGVLAHQLIKYAENQVDGAVLRTRALMPVQTAGLDLYHDECSPLTPPSITMLSEDEATEYSQSTASNPRKVEVVAEVTDVNGKVHQAVRIGYDSKDPSKAQPKMCTHRGSIWLTCQKAKTRVMCLQCQVPLCYPLQKRDCSNKNDYCFTTHVRLIKRTNDRAKRVKYIHV